jgi:hypothetical protein
MVVPQGIVAEGRAKREARESEFVTEGATVGVQGEAKPGGFQLGRP